MKSRLLGRDDDSAVGSLGGGGVELEPRGRGQAKPMVVRDRAAAAAAAERGADGMYQPLHTEVEAETGVGAASDASDDADDDDEPPYSMVYEVLYFFRRGVPLGAAAILQWGVPPLFAM